MFIVLLKFSNNKSSAAEYMEAHNAWIQKGLQDGVFLVVGSLQPKAGGAIVAHGLSQEDLASRVAADPFVEHDVVRAETLEITPAKTDERLAFLLAP